MYVHMYVSVYIVSQLVSPLCTYECSNISKEPFCSLRLDNLQFMVKSFENDACHKNLFI